MSYLYGSPYPKIWRGGDTVIHLAKGKTKELIQQAVLISIMITCPPILF